jgi:hypothetical protein
MKIPKTKPLIVAASYSLPLVAAVLVEGNGWKFKPLLSLLYLTIFECSIILDGASDFGD